MAMSSLTWRSAALLAACASTVYAQGSGSPTSRAPSSSGSSSASRASSGSSSSGGGGGSYGGGSHQQTDPDINNDKATHYMVIAWACIVVAFMIYQVVIHVALYIRTVACLKNDTQRYFLTPTVWYARLKKYFLDAPLWKLRHHREFRLSSAVNVGTLPSRFQSFFLAGFFAMNIALLCWDLPWHLAASSLGTERAQVWEPLFLRAGVLSVCNMIPLFLFAGRNNPLIPWTGISFDTFNLFHRWLGRISAAEALVHTIFWMIKKVATAKNSAAGWAMVSGALGSGSQMILTGTIAMLAFIVIVIQAASPIRHAFYEFFLHFHQVLAAAAVGALWYHVGDGTPMTVLKVVVALWVIERAARVIRIFYRNIGAGGTKATIEVLPGDALRVTVRLARPWKFHPGQHAYMYLPRVGWWTSHPFTVAWSEDQVDVGGGGRYVDEKGLVMHSQDVLALKKTTYSMIVRRRTGFTDKLYRHAEEVGGGKFTTSAILEGPYGSETFHSYGTVLLFAAGVGITHQVPHVRDLVVGYSQSTCAIRRITLVWIIQSPEHLEWIRPWMTTILGLPKRREVLKILLFVTRPRSTKEIHSPSSSVQMFPGKPNIVALVDAEAEQRVGAMCVSVCGTGSLADDVRSATRSWQTKGEVDFAEESFSW